MIPPVPTDEMGLCESDTRHSHRRSTWQFPSGFQQDDMSLPATPGSAAKYSVLIFNCFFLMYPSNLLNLERL